MRALASLVCGFVFGWGLFISGMIRPDKVLGFLDIFAIPSGNWDPSLVMVMAAALAVTGIGYALVRRGTPVFEAQNQWPTQTAIDRPLIAGAALFGIGWGLVGLCPGPAIANLATWSSPRDRLCRRHGGRHHRSRCLVRARHGADTALSCASGCHRRLRQA